MSDFEPGYHLVEIMGHRTHVGYCTEVGRFGTSMLRIETIALGEIPGSERPGSKMTDEYFDDATRRYIDVVKPGKWVRPATPAVPSQVFEYGGSAIFSLTPMTEEEAREQTLAKHRPRPEHFVADDVAPLMIAAPDPSSVTEEEEPFQGPFDSALTPEEISAAMDEVGAITDVIKGAAAIREATYAQM